MEELAGEEEVTLARQPPPLPFFISNMLVFPNWEGSRVKAKPRAPDIAFTYS